MIQPGDGATLVAEPERLASWAPLTQPEPFPYSYRMSGGSTTALPNWQVLGDLLQLVGMHRQYYFLTVDRTDGVERWAQVIGHPDAMAVELAVANAPMRVYRSGDDQSSRMLTSSVGTHVEARQADLFTAAEALVLIRIWLAHGALGIEGTAVRCPDDWARMNGWPILP